MSYAFLLKSEVLMSVGLVEADPRRKRIGVWSNDRTGCSPAFLGLGLLLERP